MNRYKWYYIGNACFGFCLGMLIAFSKSPVLGIVITSIFGFAGTIIALVKKIKTSDKEQDVPIPINYNLVGKTLFTFALSLIAGVGSIFIISMIVSKKTPEKDFAWTNNDNPSSVYEALDWVMVDDALEKAGFSKEQVRQIYQLRKAPNTTEAIYYKENPYHLFLKPLTPKKQVDLRFLTLTPFSDTSKNY